jgi:pyruvate dehydrogenase E1 component alpha subunit
MFLEYMTYRFRGHSMGDPERYRKSAEVKRWELDDPIGVFYDYLIKNKISTESGLKKIEKATEDEVLDAVQFAEESPEPAPEELFTDIYA